MLQDEIKAHMHGVNSGGAYSQCDNFLLVSCLLIEFETLVGGHTKAIWWHLIAKLILDLFLNTKEKIFQK